MSFTTPTWKNHTTVISERVTSALVPATGYAWQNAEPGFIPTPANLDTPKAWIEFLPQEPIEELGTDFHWLQPVELNLATLVKRSGVTRQAAIDSVGFAVQTLLNPLDEDYVVDAFHRGVVSDYEIDWHQNTPELLWAKVLLRYRCVRPWKEPETPKE